MGEQNIEGQKILMTKSKISRIVLITSVLDRCEQQRVPLPDKGCVPPKEKPAS